VGESLSAIASRYGVSVDEILAANDLLDPDTLLVGQTLLIPQ
jgi:LysM repeat protein